MRLALVQPEATICPQCGGDWMAARAHSGSFRRPEFCPRCGSPVAGLGFDPLRATVYGGSGIRVSKRAKLVVRFGVLAVGLVGFLAGLSLVYGGWVSPGGMDAIQLWVSRIGGPVLLAQGLFYAWIPFRRPAGGVVVPFASRRRQL